jgi:hypothetical protein
MSLSALGDNPFFQVLEAQPAQGIIYLNEGTGLVDLSGVVSGPEGLPGISGEEGPVGDVGPVGETGSQGPTGPVGETGSKGATGPVGETGSQGQIGDKGPVGNQGPIGQAGVGGTSWEFIPYPVEQPVGSPGTLAPGPAATAYFITANPQTGGSDLTCPVSLTSSNVGILWRFYNGNDVGNNNMWIQFSGAASQSVQLNPHQALDAMLCAGTTVGSVVLVVRKYLPGT